MEQHSNYKRIEKAIKYLIARFKQQPSLEELAAHTGMSPFHFQRIFAEWAGVSPKKFLEYLTIESLKRELSESSSLFEAAGNAGLSSPSRVYDLFVNIEAVTPGQYKTSGKGLEIEYGFAPTPFGDCFIAATGRGVCSIQFEDGNKAEILAAFANEWTNAVLHENHLMVDAVAKKLFYSDGSSRSFSLLLKGTPFQLKVWEALLKIPVGMIVSYNTLARAAGNAAATRAVASAVARNPIGYLIPCHRVIRNEGVIGQYHWSPARKAAIIAWEKSLVE